MAAEMRRFVGIPDQEAYDARQAVLVCENSNSNDGMTSIDNWLLSHPSDSVMNTKRKEWQQIQNTHVSY